MIISIIIPVYNISQHIVRCLSSVSAQTYQNIECLLIDDCGTDNSIYLAEQFIEKYEGNIRFKIIHHQYNQGQSVARNTGISESRGDYVYFLDGDDSITSDCISILVGLATKYPQANFVQGNTVCGKGCMLSHHFACEVPEFCENSALLEDLILKSTVTTAWNRLVKRTFIVENGLYFPNNISVAEDLYWVYSLRKYAHAVAYTNAGTYYYYVNPNSTMTSTTLVEKKRRIDGIAFTTNEVLNDMVSHKDITTKAQLQFFGGLMVSYLVHMIPCKSFSNWVSFWKLAIRMILIKKMILSFYGLLFFLLMMPPFCFFAAISGWRWRIRKYVVNRM